jgi:hypothetical protein
LPDRAIAAIRHCVSALSMDCLRPFSSSGMNADLPIVPLPQPIAQLQWYENNKGRYSPGSRRDWVCGRNLDLGKAPHLPPAFSDYLHDLFTSLDKTTGCRFLLAAHCKYLAENWRPKYTNRALGFCLRNKGFAGSQNNGHTTIPLAYRIDAGRFAPVCSIYLYFCGRIGLCRRDNR